MDQLQDILHYYWGYERFRANQQEAMEAVLRGQDSLTVLPTGGGKSLCFQAPALALDGMALIISPLIALMKDQVDALKQRDIPAACINSHMSGDERRAVHKGIQTGQLKLIYTSPEKAVQGRFIEYIKRVGLSFIAVDEAHCVSQWGHDFRKEYRLLNHIRNAFPGLPMHAYTATATTAVRKDIVSSLGLRDAKEVVGSYDRPNLTYHVENTAGAREREVERIVQRHRGAAGIVYCITRREVDSMAEHLAGKGHRAVPYHAGMDDVTRRCNQDAFLRGQVDIVVATVAFGMGIDKPDVRFVIHAGLPKSLEHYQQESGRAGRDGKPSECWLLYRPADYYTWQNLIQRSAQGCSPEVQANAETKLDAMYAYCQQTTCRRATLLLYFGETMTSCGGCDVCDGGGRKGVGQTQERRPRSRKRRSTSSHEAHATALADHPDRRQGYGQRQAERLFREGVSVREAAQQLELRPRKTWRLLEQFVVDHRVTDPSPWVNEEKADRIRQAAAESGDNRVSRLQKLAGGDVKAEEIEVVLACQRNGDPSLPY
ncbi:MAG: RecQ family ATP-dependent DNA helicase [Candidatus Hydrogenedentota bacterium]